MKELIIGVDGFIGSKLSQLLPEAIQTSRRFSYLNGPYPFDLSECGPLPDADIVYLCAGVNGSLSCAQNPQETYRTNVDGTLYVAEFCKRKAAHLIWISSTTVEWCNEAYALQKRTTEQALRFMPHVGIVRAGRVTHQNVFDLAQEMIRIGRNKETGVHLWNADEKPYDKALAA